MKIRKEKFEQMLEKYDINVKKVYDAIKGLKQTYDYNAGDKSLTQLAIYPTESIELTTKENWNFINIIYFSSPENESIDRNIMADKPQFLLCVNMAAKELGVTPYYGCDDQWEAKAQTLKDILSDALKWTRLNA